MRIAVLAVLLFSCSTALLGRAAAQTIIPNGGFEVWDSVFYPDTGFLPMDWGGDIYDTMSPIFQSLDAHSGMYALGGRNVIVNDTLIPPIVGTWIPSSEGTLPAPYFPLIGSPTAFEGWYKLNSVGNDYLQIGVFSVTLGGVLAFFTDSISENSYTYFSVPLPHTDSSLAFIRMEILNTSGIGHLGTTFVIDDLAFTYASAVNPVTNLNFGLEQNYPNPFNSETTIKYSIPANDNVTIEIINMLGERVALLENGNESQGEHEVFFHGDRFASGTYVCRLITASHGVSSNIIQLSH